MSVARPTWMDALHRAWRAAPVAWLTGVRRVGKTTLALQVPDALYLNCDLPSVAQRLSDPEDFYSSIQQPVVIFDEVHQLSDPSRLLKIGADTRPRLRILATGSSTLAATEKFRDSLSGRKRVVILQPVLVEELRNFGITDLLLRLLRGGLPQALTSSNRDLEFYSEWLDSFYARDVQELFRVEKRRQFMLLLEVLLRQSGGLLEVQTLAKLTGLTRPTVINYINVLEVTHAVRLLRPFHGGGRREILRQPKAYAFDTGFVCYARGWDTLRPEDHGLLWEHAVLDELLSLPGIGGVKFWRDKSQREVDFVLPQRDKGVDAIECKWSAAAFEARALKEFRSIYAKGTNYCVVAAGSEAYRRTVDGLDVIFAPGHRLRDLLAGHS